MLLDITAVHQPLKPNLMKVSTVHGKTQNWIPKHGAWPWLLSTHRKTQEVTLIVSFMSTEHRLESSILRENLNHDSGWHGYHYLPRTVSMALYVLTHVSWWLSCVIGSPVLRLFCTVEETEAQMETFCLRTTVKWMAESMPFLCSRTISSPLTCNCELCDLDPGNRIWVFSKNSMCSWPLSHVSALKSSLLG